MQIPEHAFPASNLPITTLGKWASLYLRQSCVPHLSAKHLIAVRCDFTKNDIKKLEQHGMIHMDEAGSPWASLPSLTPEG